MLEFMKDNYIINSTIVDLLFLSCNVCNVKCNFEYPPTSEKEKIDATKNKDFLRELRNTVYLDLINMTDRPDGLFEYLLIYVYKDSSFTLLRPLMKKCPIEISMEFLKIFLDFGPPTKFEVFVQDSVIFTQALDHLKSVSMSYCIPIIDSWKPGMNSDFPTNVLRSIQEWITDTGGDNWGLGCHILQWKLNNQAICGSNNDEKNESQKYRTPYTRFFGSNVQVPFDLSNIGNVAVQNSEETNDNSFPIMDTITLEDNDKDDDEIDDPVIIEEPPQETSLYKIINTTSIQIADIESRSTNDSKMDVVEEETKPN
ncbi:unnamed protein product [Diatraea saccharalis]|uniref:Uncharacterized protein n=1 Tax=Diatraea saccharalis TaxID=40085 RepID=A0A9N9WIQ8_9NEOP|nr:unnamed protein product [Diatraea saccharalis]